METTNTLPPETAEILESLNFIEKECLAAWQNSAKTTKELGLLREARACLLLKMKILGIGARKAAPALAEPEPQIPATQPEAKAAEAPQTPPAPAETPLEDFRRQYTPESFLQLNIYARAEALRRYGLTQTEARMAGYEV